MNQTWADFPCDVLYPEAAAICSKDSSKNAKFFQHISKIGNSGVVSVENFGRDSDCK